jgi:hypothetical protein
MIKTQPFFPTKPDRFCGRNPFVILQFIPARKKAIADTDRLELFELNKCAALYK